MGGSDVRRGSHLVAEVERLERDRPAGRAHGHEMGLRPQHEPTDADAARPLQCPQQQRVWLRGVAPRGEVIGLLEVHRVDVVELDEVLQLDRPCSARAWRARSHRARASRNVRARPRIPARAPDTRARRLRDASSSDGNSCPRSSASGAVSRSSVSADRFAASAGRLAGAAVPVSPSSHGAGSETLRYRTRRPCRSNRWNRTSLGLVAGYNETGIDTNPKVREPVHTARGMPSLYPPRQRGNRAGSARIRARCAVPDRRPAATGSRTPSSLTSTSAASSSCTAPSESNRSIILADSGQVRAERHPRDAGFAAQVVDRHDRAPLPIASLREHRLASRCRARATRPSPTRASRAGGGSCAPSS